MMQNNRIFDILSEVRPECDFRNSEDFITDGLLDSFDLVMLVSSLEKAFNVRIPGELIVAENFVSAAAIASLIEKCSK